MFVAGVEGFGRMVLSSCSNLSHPISFSPITACLTVTLRCILLLSPSLESKAQGRGRGEFERVSHTKEQE